MSYELSRKEVLEELTSIDPNTGLVELDSGEPEDQFCNSVTSEGEYMTHPCPTCNGSGFVEVTPVSVIAPPRPPDTDQKPKPNKPKQIYPYNLSHLRRI